MESGVEFVAVDNPHANKLTVHILAAVAQHEREMISERTKAALAAAKRRGQRLGNPNLPKAAKRGVAALKSNARQFAANVRPIIEEFMRAGATSHNAIAAKLNERNVRTARGGVWDPCTGWSNPAPFRRRKRRPRMTAKSVGGRQHR
jgi:DNA invertase Pin-like site-specific DNA recombinase